MSGKSKWYLLLNKVDCQSPRNLMWYVFLGNWCGRLVDNILLNCLLTQGKEKDPRTFLTLAQSGAKCWRYWNIATWKFFQHSIAKEQDIASNIVRQPMEHQPQREFLIWNVLKKLLHWEWDKSVYSFVQQSSWTYTFINFIINAKNFTWLIIKI